MQMSPAGQEHLVQFYESSRYLVERAAGYLREGLARNEPALLVVTPSHRDAMLARLRQLGVDVDALLAEDRLAVLDVEETLEKILIAGLPDWERFRSATGAVLKRLARGDDTATIRCFGEMVDLLWRSGRMKAALMLEELWNELGHSHRFQLLCGYSMWNFRSQADAVLLQRVCETHSHVAPTERYSRIESDEARLREVTLLQQRALALESEIEHRRRAEQELLEALQLRDDFLCVAGHELKTPLTVLQLQLHAFLNRGEALNEEDRERVERAQRQADRLTDLVEELLDVSRINAGRLELVTGGQCDLAELVQAVAGGLAEPAKRAGCELELQVPGPVLGAWDRGRIEQVLAKLLGNAVKYGAGRPIQLSVQGAKDRARLIVRDHGPGIRIEDQARIFNRFERAASSRNYGGLGLGLWIARQVVEAHGGVIRLDSEPGQGATFTVELPYEELRPARPSAGRSR